MSSLAISAIIFCIICGGALAGMAIRSRLSQRHLEAESKDVVKVAMGLIGMLSALVLGLVLATAKSSYDDKSSQVRQMAAKVILLDNLLLQYGPETAPLRKHLRQGIDGAVDRIWQEDGSVPQGPFEATAVSLMFLEEIDRLSPQSDAQRSLQARAVQAGGDIAQIRLMLFARSGASIPTPFLVVLVFWLATLFASFTMLSQTHSIAILALLVSAMSLAGAIFLILELDHPFTGFVQIPSALLRNALPPLGP